MMDFHNIQVWQKAYDLTLKVYKSTESFPKQETYGLTSQLRRAAMSISCNIAEGCVKNSDADFARFLDIAIGSASEVECQLLLACDLKYLENPKYEELNDAIVEIKRMLTSFIKTLRKTALRNNLWVKIENPLPPLWSKWGHRPSCPLPIVANPAFR